MSEAEVIRDFAAVLENLRSGAEVVVEQDRQPVAVIRAAQAERPGRPISEAIAAAGRSGSTATLDGEFGKDLQEIIDRGQTPWNPPEWD